MPSSDLRIAKWNVTASAGVTQRWEFVSSVVVTTLVVYVGGTTDDVDDLTDADPYTATIAGNGLTATVDVDIPTGRLTPLRLVVDGVVETVGILIPQTGGRSSVTGEITLTTETRTFGLTVLGGVLGQEGIQDAVGAMVTGNTETGIAVTYDDTTGKLNFVAEVTQAELDAEATARDAKVAQTITNGVTTSAPSQDAVFDALALKADLASPALTGNPTAPTPTAGDDDTSIATTAFVQAAASEAVATLPSLVTGPAPHDQAVAVEDGDEIYFKFAGSPRVLASTGGSTTTVSSTSSETTLLPAVFTPAANVIAAADHLAASFQGTVSNTSGSDQTFRWRIDVGGTDVIDTGTLTIASNASGRAWRLLLWLRATSVGGGTFNFWQGQFIVSNPLSSTCVDLYLNKYVTGNSLVTSFSSPASWDLTITHGSNASTSITACNLGQLERRRLGS